ncbi:MAG: NAD(P)-dependent oxidoreductase [Gemmatales bacterium]|nr:MAG: NAD(P)-dependent oxidoreductase [Gemmatales bacterium]
MRYAIVGAAGQLGSEFCRLLGDNALPLFRRDLDLLKPEKLRAVLKSAGPDLVINCAAYNFVDRAEDEVESAFAVNFVGVRALALACRDLHVPLVHFSTDYVYGLDADRNTPYTVHDAPGPLSVYGMSKLAGEYAVRATLGDHFVIRTCGLYGDRQVAGSGKQTNFVTTMLRLADSNRPIRVVNDQHCTPTFARDVAAVTMELVKGQRFGLHHLTNDGSTTWFEFARTIFHLANRDVQLEAISSEAYGAKARRPNYSVLENTYPMRPWPEALQDYLQTRENVLGSALPSIGNEIA